MRCAAERGMSGGTNDRQIFIEHQRNFDQEVRSAKRHYWYQQQQNLLLVETRLSTDFWKTMGGIGISQSHTHSIPWEVVNDDQFIISDPNVVLKKWKEAFGELLNTNVVSADNNPGEMLGEYPVLTDTTSLNEPITIDEVCFALTTAKKEKAVGEDEIPMEVLQNKECIAYLVDLYKACFETASIPVVWSHGIIHPIIKDSKNDNRDPFNYRGITNTSVTYKLYCSILNNRLSRLLEFVRTKRWAG